MTAGAQGAKDPGRRNKGALRRTTLRRLALTSAVLTALVGADGLYMQVTGYHASDSNNFQLSDAATVFFATGVLLICTLVLLAMCRQACRVLR